MRSKGSAAVLSWINFVTAKTKVYVAVLVLIQSVLGVAGVCFAMLLRKIVNAATAGERDAFFGAVFLFAALIVFQIALRAAGRFFEELSRSTMENRFKDRLFSTLLVKDYASVTQVNSGEWINRLTSDTVVVADGVTHLLPGLSGMLVKLAGAIGAILFLEPRFLWLLIPGGLVLILFTYAFRKVLKSLHRNIQEADGRLRVFMQECLSSLMIIRTFAQERCSDKRAEDLMEAHKSAKMKRNHFSNFCGVGFSVAMNGVYILGTVFCGYGILTGTMSYGNLLAMLQLIGQVQSPFANITGYLPRYYAMIASAERLMEAEYFVDDLPAKDVSECKRLYNDDFKGISLRDVSFTYRPPTSGDDIETRMPSVFSDIDIEIKKGEYVAFTGPSGCGKSTVLKLIMCLYPLDSGRRMLMTDDSEVELTSEWRSLFAYVPQGNQLLSGSIREILAFGDSERMKDEENFRKALRIACADDFVDKLDNGLDSVLGERGAGLSEGQMQRIAIARAVFSDHPILLLDEATSSLDEEVEARLLKNLRSMTDKTVVIVTHRSAVLPICDYSVDFGRLLRRDSDGE